ncbi:hypothetical protein ACOSQ3_015163 [Xanthoceras sorbifolium]
MSSSTSSPLTFDPSLDFQSLARTLNFNLPFKLDKTNYVNWKAQLNPAFSFWKRVNPALLALVNCFSSHSCLEAKVEAWEQGIEEKVNGIIRNCIVNCVKNLVMQLHNAAKDFIRIGMAIAINHFLSNLHSLINLKLS